MTNCVFSGNGAAYYGGGIYNQGTLVVSGSTFSSNSALYGGAVSTDSTATIENSTFSGNAAGEQGGGIFNAAGLSVSSSTFSGNSGVYGGGAIYNFGGGEVTLANSILAGNSGGDCNTCGTQSANNLIGGDAHLGPLQYNGGSTLTMMPLSGSPAIGAGSGSRLTPDQRGFACSTCRASDLGAVQTNYLTVTTLTDSGAGSLRDAITLASAAGSADIIFQSGLTGTITLASGLPNITGDLNLEGPGANVITVSGANAYPVFTIPGTGIFVNFSGLTVANALGANPSDGGGINNSGALLTVSNSAFTGNTVPTGYFGGAIGSYGSAPSTMVTNSTFSGNQSQGGGGIFSSVRLVVTNSTFFGNIVPSGNIGGGILSDGPLLVADSTFTGNSAVQGGGIANLGSTALVTNSILAGNSGGDCYKCTQIGPVFTGGNPELSPLQLNGAKQTVPTMLPLPGSPAIQFGDPTQLPAGLTMDQRGFPRTTAGKLDVGAAQTNYTSVQFVQQPTNALINANIAPGITVEVLETNTNLTAPNNTDAVSGIPITLTVNGGPLIGTLTQTTSGVATFSDLEGSTPSTGDTLATSVAVTPTGTTPAQILTATSDPFDITLPVPTLNFNPPLPASVTYGVAPLTLKANSYFSGTPTGQTVNFQVDSGPAAATGNVLTIVGAGTVVVEVDAAVNSSYAAADTTSSITVQQAPLTITANNATRVYGAANPAFAGIVSAAANGDSFTESFVTAATATSPAGSYAIVPTAVGAHLADYAVTNVNGTLTVTAAATTTTLGSSVGAITGGQSVTFTAMVASSGGTPTGMVTFYNGTTSIGTGTLNSSGVATLTIGTLAAGGNPAFAASYGATPDYAASVSPTVSVTVAVAIPSSFTMVAAPASLSIPQGQTGKTALQLIPAGGFSGTVTFRCSNLPANAVCAFVQNSVTLSGDNQPVNVGLTIYTSVQQARTEPIPQPQHSPFSPILPALAFWSPGGLAGLVAFGRKRKLAKSQHRWLHLCLLLVVSSAVAMGLAGCGGTGLGANVTPAGTATVTVTATPGTGTAVAPQTVKLILTIAQ